MRYLPRGVRAGPSHQVSRKGKSKELEKQVLLRGWHLLSSVFLHLLLETVAICVCPCPAKGGPSPPRGSGPNRHPLSCSVEASAGQKNVRLGLMTA